VLSGVFMVLLPFPGCGCILRPLMQSSKASVVPKKKQTMFLKFEHYDLAFTEVSHYGFLRGHSSIS
jgi:hypothetical protein